MRLFLIIALVFLPAGLAATRIMTSDEILDKYAITTRVGPTEIPPGEGASAAIIAAVQKSEGSGRITGLPDDLNPVVLDKDKVEAFLSALPKVAGSALEKLRRRTLHLNNPSLQLHSYSAVTPAALRHGYTLEVDNAPEGSIANVQLDAAIDPKLGRERADRAKKAMQDADREVAELEKKKRQPNADSALFVAHSNAQRKRYAAASVWRDLVSALATRDSNHRALQSEAAEAKQAASKYIVAPWTGMPE